MKMWAALSKALTFRHEPNQRAPAARSVLVVDDDTLMRPIIQQIVNSLNPRLQFRWAVTAEEARRELATSAPDVIIADCLLGTGESGLGLWQYCLQHHPRIEFILMSGLSGPSLRKLSRLPEAIELPPLLAKPVGPTVLRARLKDLLSA